MKILIITLGSRGDVQPYVALGKGLKDAGHQVTLCTSSSFEGFVTEHGLTYGYMNNDLVELARSDAGRTIMENANNVFKILTTSIKMIRQMTPMQRAMLKDSWETARKADPDLIIFHPKAYGGAHFAEKLGVPCILSIPLPMLVPSSEFANFGLPAWPLGRWYNRMTHIFVLKMMGVFTRRFIKRWRREEGLPPLPRGHDYIHTTQDEQIPVMHCYSAHVGPAPSDWPDSVTATGYWFLDQGEKWQPPPELIAFLKAGDPPVYVGFGSIAGRNPERVTRNVIAALAQAGVRGILATGWGGLNPGDLPETLFKIDHAPHDWLFPRMAAVVHHGGAGTTAAGLRYGKPTIICPFFGDQPFWGARIHALGAGAKPIPQKKLTASKLAEAIREVMENASIRRNAEALGEKIRGEDGIGNAVRFIEKYGMR